MKKVISFVLSVFMLTLALVIYQVYLKSKIGFTFEFIASWILHVLLLGVPLLRYYEQLFYKYLTKKQPKND